MKTVFIVSTGANESSGDVIVKSEISCCWISSAVSLTTAESGISFKVVSILKPIFGAPTPKSANVMRLLKIFSWRNFQGLVAGVTVVDVGARFAAGCVVVVALVVLPPFMNER